ncbi:MAG TPA: zf-HC2 domain-containing protein [Candidatus Binatia bacterium]|jgi:predicted anti-sigma-YlaC factor YlaD
MKTCVDTRESISAWLDGELSGAEADAVGSHLETCLVCAEERRQLEKLNRAMIGVFESEEFRLDTEPFWRGLQQRIAAQRPWYADLAERAGPFFRAPSFAWAVPAVIVLLIGALYFQSILPGWGVGVPRNNFAAVESIDAYGRNVALLREYESRTTVIWLYQNPDSEDEAAGETNDKGPAF